MSYTDGYLKKYSFEIPLHSPGVTAHHLDWAEKYCKGKFGWHFDHQSNAIISFEKEQDATFWYLRWSEHYNIHTTCSI